LRANKIDENCNDVLFIVKRLMFDMKSKYACFILLYKHFQWKVNSIK